MEKTLDTQKNPSVTFYGGVGHVTGANFLFQASGRRFLVDCGLSQGGRDAYERNAAPFPYDPSSIDALFITHAHIDHIGRIPKLVKDGFKGAIYSTPVTRDITELMLEDALRVMEYHRKERKQEPIYSESHIREALSLWKGIPYHETKKLGGIDVSLKDAGHILGSAMIEFTVDGKKTVFSGDLGNSPDLLLRDTEPITGAHFLIMESVYGDRNHNPKGRCRECLADIVNETLERGGTLVIPAFSLERTQTILYEINELLESKQIPSVPVFLDSPLAIRVTEIFERVTKHYNESTKNDIAGGDEIFSFPTLKKTARVKDSRAIARESGPKIIIAGSGMSVGGRVIEHESHYLPDPKSTILLVGYQSWGSLGRKIQEGAKSIEIEGKKVPVRARIEKLDGYSSHKDSDDLVDFVATGQETLKKVFVAMGEPKSSLFLVQRIRDYLDINAVYPEEGETYELGS